ncbi:MAG: gliding motility-associated C-terminal domain-containing protein [Ferruginibacter sp.]
MYKFICQITVLLLVSSVSIAQQGNKSPTNIFPVNNIQNDQAGICGFDISLNRLRHDSKYQEGEEKMNRKILNFHRNLNDDSAIVVVPVVFHIINQDPSVVPDLVILNALKELNDAFGKRGNYAGSEGVDTKIRFCLAQKDPDGGNTTGITRTKSFFSTHLNPVIEDGRLKNLIQWDPSRYINIWYIASMDMEGLAEFLCGRWTRSLVGSYATMPPGGDAIDGIVLTAFDNLLIHEMGHYLGLYHTYEGRNCANNDCTTDGDRVCDTPPDRSLKNSFSCNNPENSCNTDTLSNYSNGNFTTDVPDQIANFMDFGNEACVNEFTQGQADRMNAVIQTLRSGLLQNECDKPCSENINAAFERNNAYPVPGNSIRFTNKSTGASGYQWLVNNVVVSTDTNFGYTFNATGKFKVTLKAYHTNSCYAIYSDFVIVNCGVTARFYTGKRTIASKIPLYPDSIHFTNTSENATSYKWMMSSDQGMTEQLVGTAKDLVYVFPLPANYGVRLIATNGACTDTTNTFTIPVLDPTPDWAGYMSTVDCYQQTKIRVTFFGCNNGFATIPPNTPVSFYDADPRLGNAHKLAPTFYIPDSITGRCCSSKYSYIIDVNQPGLNILYMVFNDSGNSMPLVLPNTPLIESNYDNNVTVATNFSFKAAVLPPQPILEPGDTLQLVAQAGPGVVASYHWSPAGNLSCTDCSSPYLVADSDRVKRMIATSQYGCVDTAFADIKVPPANDYSIDLNEVQCAAGARLYVNFTLHNQFKRGVIPKGITVSFYDGDPASATARILPPVFSVPDTVFGKQFTFSGFIKGISRGRIYAVVNDSGTEVPVRLPNNNLLPEKSYSNNGADFLYEPEKVKLQPQDTIVFRKSAFPLIIETTTYNPASTSWFNGNGYTLNCNQCPAPVVTVFDTSMVTMQTENKYGCIIKGTSLIKVFPPDMTVRIIETNCYSNSTTLVKFELCMNNKYDSVFAGLPVSFYDAHPFEEGAKLLSPVFYTPGLQQGNCYTYQHIIATPASGRLYASVNDMGNSSRNAPGKVFNETNYDNNKDNSSLKFFIVSINPSDTTITRSGSVQLTPMVSGGNLSSWLWKPDPFLSCVNCLAPIVTPLYTSEYMFVGRNEYACVDTAWSIVKTFTGGSINLPSAFSPNHDGLNDIFYVLAGKGVNLVNDFSVFDRWGQKIYEAKNIPPNDPRYGWDGNYKGVEAAPGTYVYLIRLPVANGKDQVFKGTIVLIR